VIWFDEGDAGVAPVKTGLAGGVESSTYAMPSEQSDALPAPSTSCA